MKPGLPAANPQVLDTGTPPIPEARGWLAAYDGRAGAPINLSQAAPGQPPPPALLARLADAAGDPATATYGPIEGDDALRAAYAEDVAAVYGVRRPLAEFAITTGCNQAFMVAVMALAKAGDEVILPEPWYFNHEMTLRMLGIGVAALPCRAERGFVPEVETARRLITPRTRAIVLVTPNNPTGAIYPPETLAAFARLAREAGLWLIVDETYRDFMTEAGPPHALLAGDDEARVVQLYSFSKSYAVPGHRIGALRAPERLMPEIGKVLDCLQICPPRVGQAALAWAIPALASWREANRRVIVERAAAFVAALGADNAQRWQVCSLGAYFAYVRHPFEGVAAVEVSRRLAREAGVLALPGTYFGGAGQSRFLRFAFANADVGVIRGIGARLARIGET